MSRSTFAVTLLTLLSFSIGGAQEARLKPAEEFRLPGPCDGNSPLVWLNRRLHLFTSNGATPKVSTADSHLDEWHTREIGFTNLKDKTVWIEAAWVDDDGTILGWYHHEPWGMYEDSLLTAPKIGAVISEDGGRTFTDLGIILETGDPLDDQAQNGYFTGGHGDFTVILDRERKHFYFLFTNYNGPEDRQGVVMARLHFEDRYEPVGKVHKYFNGGWNEPGLGGRTTPVLPVTRAWGYSDVQSFWGPAVHWNTYLNCFVILLNRTNGEPGWSQDGIYVCFTHELDRPASWTKPVKLIDGADLPHRGAFYPQIIGLERNGSDTLAGRIARLYLHGVSSWEIEFILPPPPEPEPEPEN
jgi:hypothetical protein